MRVMEVMRLAREAGVEFSLMGGRAVMKATRKPLAPEALALIREHRTRITAVVTMRCAQCGAGAYTDPPSDPPTVQVVEGGRTEWLHPECADYRERRYGKRRT